MNKTAIYLAILAVILALGAGAWYFTSTRLSEQEKVELEAEIDAALDKNDAYEI